MLGLVAEWHAVFTLLMTGLIWYVQLVHYPLFRYADPTRYAEFQRAHESRTSWIVGPVMLGEAATALALTRVGWNRLPAGDLGYALALLVLIWLSTAFLQVPRHRDLKAGFDASAHRFLVVSNWVRTLAWTARAGLALRLLRAVSGS